MSKYRIALTRENQSRLAKAANEDGRSLVKQLNHILAAYFSAACRKVEEAKKV